MTNHTHDERKLRGFWNGLVKGSVAGLLIGGLIGAIALLLLAPHSGKRTRAKLRRQSHELREQTAETVEGALDQARNKSHQITHDVRKQAEELEHCGQAMFDGQKGR